MEAFFYRVISTKKIESIVHPPITEDGLFIGELTDYDPEMAAACFNQWTRQIDKFIGIDRELNDGTLSWRGHKAMSWRGVTFPEFGDLFSPHIPEEEFSFYPVFGQAKLRAKVSIKTEKDRAEVTSKYENDLENYITFLVDNGFEPLLKFFFSFGKRGAYLPHQLLRIHTHITGSTGSGKTMLCNAMFFEMTKKMKRTSFILIDPHGDIARVALKNKHFARNPERIAYINPTFKKNFTPSFNPFQISDNSFHTINHVVDNLIVSFEEVLSRDDKFSEVQINTLEKCLYFILSRKTVSTILDLQSLLEGQESIFKEAQIFDPNFFDEGFIKHSNKTRISLLSRIQRMLNSPILYNLLGAKSTFDLERSMNTGKILIFNLASLPELTAETFSKFLVASIKSIARKRQKNNFLCPTYLFLDEAHLLTSGSWSVMLEQLRGFGLHLVISHQFPNQLKEQKETVKFNTAIKIFSPTENTEDSNLIVKIPENVRPLNNYEFYLKCRNQKMRIFKIPKKFITKRKKYEMSKKELAYLKKMQLERYYRKIKNGNDSQAPIEKGNPKSPIPDSPKPPFALNINK